MHTAISEIVSILDALNRDSASYRQYLETLSEEEFGEFFNIIITHSERLNQEAKGDCTESYLVSLPPSELNLLHETIKRHYQKWLTSQRQT